MTTNNANRFGLAWSTFTVRWVLGLIFFMAGWWKCFSLMPTEHAQKYFLVAFEGRWIPEWFLWSLGVTIPIVELVAGALVCLGLFRRPAYVALGLILIAVTYGHLLLEPLFNTTNHIFPRLVLLAFLCAVPKDGDILSVDYLIAQFQSKARAP